MRAALVQDGQVISVIELPEGWPDVPRAWAPPPGVDVVPSDLADVGDTYEEGSFIRNFEAELDGFIYSVPCDVARVAEDGTDYVYARIADLKLEPVREVGDNV